MKDPIERYTLLVLFQALEDRATELTISPTHCGAHSPIRYKVDGTWYEFSPPPDDIPPRVVAELARLSGLTEKPFPKEGPNRRSLQRSSFAVGAPNGERGHSYCAYSGRTVRLELSPISSVNPNSS
jgi:hypothetical protein